MAQHSQFKTILSAFPHPFQTSFFKQLNNLISYSPTVGLMRKTGAGKSSLINALFQSALSPVSNVSGCTRQAQRFNMTMNNHTLTFVDLPGVGESLERDKEYHQLYRNLLPEFDLIIWVLKADDRAWSSDEQCYRFLT
ncbi:YfjP family GTPase, partial [Providencia rettgeri]